MNSEMDHGSITSKPNPDPSVRTTEGLEREVNHVKELMDSELKALSGILEERFKAVESKFMLVEDRRVEQKQDTQAGLQAALAAAKEAVGKAEIATSEQLKQLRETFEVAISGVVVSVNDLKGRMDSTQGTKLGAGENRTLAFSVVAALASIAGIIVVVVSLLGK